MNFSNIEDLLIPLERTLYGHPLAGLLWERQFEKVLVLTVNDEMTFFSRKRPATNVRFDGLRGSLHTGVQMQLNNRPAVAKNRDIARQAAAKTERP